MVLFMGNRIALGFPQPFPFTGRRHGGEEALMGKINQARVILGGIVGGIVINILQYLVHDVVLKAQHEEMMKALGKTMPESGTTLVWWIVYGFVWAIAAVWLYAAIRPRFGPGAKTAVFAGITAWFFSCLLPAIAMWNMTLTPFSPLEEVLELVVMVCAVLAGAAIYKEA
jgi:hypothetical protein